MTESKSNSGGMDADQDTDEARESAKTLKGASETDVTAVTTAADIPDEAYERLEDAFLAGDVSAVPATEAWLELQVAHGRYIAATINTTKVAEPGEEVILIVGAPISNRKTWTLYQEQIDAFRAYQQLVRDWYESNPRPPHKRSRKRTSERWQPTFEEVRQMFLAVADAKTRLRWEKIPAMSGSSPALRYINSSGTFNIKLDAQPPTPMARIRRLLMDESQAEEGDDQSDALWSELQALDFEAVSLNLLCVSLLVEMPEVEIEVDELAKMLGRTPRSVEERMEGRRQIWVWLSLFDRLSIHGRRKGDYLDVKTGKPTDLLIQEALFRVIHPIFESEDAAQFGEGPVEVTLTAGSWLTRLRGNGKALPFYGDLRKIAAIPSGTPSGELAKRLGIVLNQRFRESRSHATVKRVGEDKHLTVEFQPFTRRALLVMAGYLSNINAILDSSDPKRAKSYWDKAIRELKFVGVVGQCKALKPIASGRQGWQDEWLNQPLDIRPGPEGTAAIAEMHRGEKAARKKRVGNKKVSATP